LVEIIKENGNGDREKEEDHKTSGRMVGIMFSKKVERE